MTVSRRNFVTAAVLAAAAVPLGAAVPRALVTVTGRPLRVVATNQRMPVSFIALNPAALGFKFRTLHIVGAPATEIVLGFCGWAVAGNVEIDAVAAHSYTKVAVEFGGVTVPVTFGGARRVTISGGVPYILSDPVPASSFGVATFARDTQFFVRAIGTAAAAARTLPSGTMALGFGMKMLTYPAGNAVDDVDGTGLLAVPAGAVARLAAPGPCLVLGRFPAGYLAVVCTGDSIADGAGDGGHVVTGHGFFGRAALDANGLNAVGSLNLTRSGSTSGTRTAGLGTPGAPGYRYRQAMLGFGNVLVDEYGTNTLGATRATPAANVVDTSRALWAVARDAGIQRIVRTTLLPRSTSTSRWSDAAGQKPSVNWGPGQARDAVNAAFAGLLASGDIDALPDTLHSTGNPSDDHLWLTNGTRLLATIDGTHPSTASHRAMGAVLRSAYGQLSVG